MTDQQPESAERHYVLRMRNHGQIVYFNPATGKFVNHPSQVTKYFSKEEYGVQVINKFKQLGAGQDLGISNEVVMPLEQALREHNGLS